MCQNCLLMLCCVLHNGGSAVATNSCSGVSCAALLTSLQPRWWHCYAAVPSTCCSALWPSSPPTFDSTVCTDGMRPPCARPTHTLANTVSVTLDALPGVSRHARDQARKEAIRVRLPPYSCAAQPPGICRVVQRSIASMRSCTRLSLQLPGSTLASTVQTALHLHLLDAQQDGCQL